MKKSILKNVAILTFALFGLGIIGNNVILAKDTIIEDPGDGGGATYNQSMGNCPGIGMTLCCTTRERPYPCSYYHCIC